MFTDSREMQSLQALITEKIAHGTGRRLRSLQVSVGNGALTIRADAPSYHVKQLALHSAFKALKSDRNLRIVDMVRVAEPSPPTLPAK